MPRSRWLGTIAFGVALGACGTESPGPPVTAARLELLTPATADGTPGWELPDTIVVRALDRQGQPLSGAHLEWTITSGGGAVTASDTSGSGGLGTAVWRLGTPEGPQQLSVGSGAAAPVAVQAMATTLHATAITSGDGWNCALDAAGKAFCWGANYSGQLGRGISTYFVSDTALEVSDGLTFTALTASKSLHTCGLAAGGAAWCWGINYAGQLGSGAINDTLSVPMAVTTSLRFTQLSANGSGTEGTTCGRTAQDEVWCWGSNDGGLLGDSTLAPGPGSYSIAPVRVQSAEAFASVKVGFFHSCALTSGGALWCWGHQYSDSGAFGVLPPGIYRTPIPVAPSYQFIDVSFANDLTCGLTVTQQAYCWGLNWFGGLGSGQTITHSADPVLVAGGRSYRSLANGGFEQLFGLSTVGEPYTWGSPACCDYSQNTPLLLTSEVTFESFDGQQDPFGACGITSSGAVYCTAGNWNGSSVRGVPVRGP
jgi:alpha-tubulin suppressor-like RCC1 family protein